MLWIDSKCFFKNCVFPQIWWASAHFDRSIMFFDRSKFFKFDWESLYLFRSIETDFRSIELVSNCFYRVSVCFDRSRLLFRSIETRETCFFKRSDCLFQKDFFKKFFNLSSLFDLSKAPPKIFCHFPLDFLQGFCLPKPVSPFCPSFCILFHDFMHFSCIVLGIFSTFHMLGFLMIQTFSGEIDQWVFVLGCYINDPCWLIWSILWFLKNWKF